MKIKKYLQFSGIIVCVLLISGLLFKDYLGKFLHPVQTTLRFPLSQSVENFDPAIVFSDDALTLISQSLDTLYQYHYLKRPYEVIASMALELPQISDQGKTYTIKIKPGLFYHEHPSLSENRDVTSEDFINQIKRLAFKPLNSTGDWLFRGKILGFNEFTEEVGTNWKKIKTTSMSGLRAIDKYTLEIKLTRPDPNLLYYLAMPFTTPVPWELIEWTQNDLSGVIVGTGAYYYSGDSQGVYHFEKYSRYRKEHYPSVGDRYANTHNLLNSSTDLLPFIPKLEFKIVENEEGMFNAFIENNVDISLVPKKYLSDISTKGQRFFKKYTQDELEMKHFSKITSRWIGLNMKDPLLGKNLNFRKAIAFALNRDKYLEIISSNTNLKANSVLNPSIPGYRPSSELPYYYDLTKAKEFLKLSGVDVKKMDPIIFSTRGVDQLQFEEAEFVKNSLNAIGIPVRIQPLEFSDFLKLGRAGKLELWIDNWIYDYPDAENIFQLLITKNHPGINKSAYSNSHVDDLYLKLSLEEDKFKRYDYMYEIEKTVNDELPWIMLMYESSYSLHRSHLKNFRRSYFIRNYLKYLRFE